jgi:hypothetical protein
VSASYLIAVIDTDRTPLGEYRSGEIVPSGEVRDYLHGMLSGHGRITRGLINGQMVEEAETATWHVDRWRGQPMRLCGFLTRIDVYPAPAGWDLADEVAWRQLAGDYDERQRERRAREDEQRRRDLIERDLHLAADDPDYPDVLAYLAEAEHSTSLDWAVKELGRFYALAARPEVARVMHPAYRRWQWAVGAAVKARRNGESCSRYETALLGEVAETTGEHQ